MSIRWIRNLVMVDAILLEDTKESIVNSVEFVFNIGIETSEYGMSNTIRLIREDGGLIIPTVNGKKLASFGDYIIKNDKGEFNTFKADAFNEEYSEIVGGHYDEPGEPGPPGNVIRFVHNGIIYEGLEEDILSLKVTLEVSGCAVVPDNVKVSYPT